MLNCWCITWTASFKRLKDPRLILYLLTDTNRKTAALRAYVRCLFPDSMLAFGTLNIYLNMFEEELTFRTLNCKQLLIIGVYVTWMFGGLTVKKAGLLLKMDSHYDRLLSEDVEFYIQELANYTGLCSEYLVVFRVGRRKSCCAWHSDRSHFAFPLWLRTKILCAICKSADLN